MRRGSIWSHVTQDGDQASRYEPFVHGGLQGAGAWDRAVDMPVAWKILAQDKHRKVLHFRKEKEGWTRRRGHRQPYTEVKVTSISG